MIFLKRSDLLICFLCLRSRCVPEDGTAAFFLRAFPLYLTKQHKESRTMAAHTPKKSRKRLRGLSLLEAVLALGIGGVVVTQSAVGLSEYSEGIKVQASASLLNRLNFAADRFAEDNFDNLVAAAPQQLNIDVLQPYFGNNINADSFGNNYALTTRTFNVNVPDPTGPGTIVETGLQVMVVALKPANSELDNEYSLRAEIASTAGAGAAFITDGPMTCNDAAGNPRPDGHICGAFGAFSFDPGLFPATNFDDVAFAALVTKGDSIVYGDELYRYDYGDPDLNTMRAELFMDGNDITNLGNINGADAISFDAANASIVAAGTGNLTIGTTDGAIRLAPNNNTVRLVDNGGAAMPTIEATGSRLRLDVDTGNLLIGDNSVATQGPANVQVATGNALADTFQGRTANVGEVNSLFDDGQDLMRIQNRQDQTTIFGTRVRYTPSGGNTYELADGDIYAQHVQVQDITCADCGGSLANILPRWRHMGTYYVQFSGTPVQGSNQSNLIIPKPNCGQNRSMLNNTAAEGNDLAFTETAHDTRYLPKIIMTPRQLATGDNASGGRTIDFRFFAIENPTSWTAVAQSLNGAAEAIAMTYCVYTGLGTAPEAPNPDLMSVQGDPTVFQRIE